GEANAPGVGQALQARGDVDPVTVDLLPIDHHVAQVDADAKLHAALGWQTHILCLQRGLNDHRALHGLDHAGKHRPHTIHRRAHDAATVLHDEGIHDPAVSIQGTQRTFLVCAHEAAVAFNIGAEDGGELAFHAYSLSLAIILPTPDLCQLLFSD